MKLTVKSYASKYGLSENAVHKRISRGTLQIEKIGKIVYIISDTKNNQQCNTKTTPNVPNQNTVNDQNKEILKILKQQIFDLKEQIKIKDQQNNTLNEQFKNLNGQLTQALKLQQESIEEKKQSNMLMAGLQKAMGLLEQKTDREYIYSQDGKQDKEVKEKKKDKKKNKKGKKRR